MSWVRWKVKFNLCIKSGFKLVLGGVLISKHKSNLTVATNWYGLGWAVRYCWCGEVGCVEFDLDPVAAQTIKTYMLTWLFPISNVSSPLSQTMPQPSGCFGTLKGHPAHDMVFIFFTFLSAVFKSSETQSSSSTNVAINNLHSSASQIFGFFTASFFNVGWNKSSSSSSY